MFGENNPITKQLQDKKIKKANNVLNNLPPKGSVNREWLDIGTNQLPGPSANYLSQQKGTLPHGANSDKRPIPNNSIPHSPISSNTQNTSDDEQMMEDSNMPNKEIDPYLNDPNPKYRRKGKVKGTTLKFPKKNGMFHCNNNNSNNPN